MPKHLNPSRLVTQFVLAAWLACWAWAAQAQDAALPAGVSKAQTVEGITEYRLANGLKVLLAPDVADARVNVNMTYLVGSRHEGYGENGMAHLLEHMLFKGTPTTPDPKQEFRKRGFNFNGTTTVDRTNYFATFESSQESLDWYIRWQADAMVNSFVARKDLDSEMTVVRNEFEMGGNNPYQTLGQRVTAAAYGVHNYGKPTIGNKADIERVDIAHLQSFYHRFYRPDNAVLIVAGKFDPAKTLQTIQQHLGPLAKPNSPLETTYTLEPAQDGERSVVVRKPAAAQLLLLRYHTPAALHADNAALQVLATALSDVPSGRLHKALVESKLAVNTFGGSGALREAGGISFGVVFGPEDDAAVRQKLLLDIVEGVAQEPIRQDEFDRAKAKINKGLELSFANAAAVAAGALQMEVLGDWRAVYVNRERMKTVTLDDVNRVAKLYLLPSNRTLGHLIPTKEPVRAPGMEPLDVAAYMKGFVLNEKGMESVDFDFSTASISQKIDFSTTPGGVQVAVLTKPVRGDMVSASISFKMGSLDALRNQDGPAHMASSMLFMGTSKLTRQQIQDELVKLGAALNLSFSETGGSLGLKVKKDNFKPALELAMHLLKDSTFPEKEFEELRAAEIKSMEGQIQDKSAQANSTWSRYGNPYPRGDTRYNHSLEEWLGELKSVTRQQAIDFYKRFYGAQQAQVRVLGPVDAPEVKRYFATALDQWMAPQPWERVPEPLVLRKPTRMVFDTPDKTNVGISAYHGVPLSWRNYNREEYAMSLAARVFGGGPGSRLWLRLREGGGLSYSVGASFSSAFYETSATLALSAQVAPENLSAAEQALQQELARSLKDGFTDAEVASFKKELLADRLRGRSGDGWVMSYMHGRQEYQDPPDTYERSDQVYATLTTEEVNAAWRKYVQPDLLVWGFWGDQSKVK